jgi:ABC-type Fe3+ transport system permease subunit
VHDPAETIKRLTMIRIVALLDFALLIPLVIAAITHAEGVVSVLGPIHGAGFLALLGLCLHGASEGRWGWWFPAIVVVTLGPPGSLYGDVRIRRQISAR